ncbi:MAG: Lrp/AsnC family transcriptional regulator [Acidobacteria bacterium]|nr:Lrp/AsnC family transcriptional regulator [Acidobacteriota bacterium]
MVNAIVLLRVERQRINDVAEQLVAVDGVSEVYSVAGQFDLVAILRTRDDDQLADVVTGHLLKIKGILSSETLIAFRVLSKHDLERLFSVGMELG